MINGNKVYGLGYEGTGLDLQQVLHRVERTPEKDLGAAY